MYATTSRALLQPARRARRLAVYLSRALSTEGYRDSDVVIVGGGPAGLALASALNSDAHIRSALNITLVEASDLSRVRNWTEQPGAFSNRVSSITNASHAFLQEIGSWDHVEHERTCPMEGMQVWDGISDARITFSAEDSANSYLRDVNDVSQMATMTENMNLQRALLRHLDGTPSVQLLDKVKVQSIQREDREGGGWPLVHLSDGRILRARLLVGADGFNSPVRSYAGIQSYGWAYDTSAIVATLVHQPRTSFQSPNTVAYQRFLPTGPIAFLPLSPTSSSLVWSTKPHLAKALLSSDPQILTTMINAAFRLPEVSLRYLHDAILDASAAGSALTLQQLREEVAWREQSHAIDPRSAYSLTSSASGVPPADAEDLPPLVTSIQPGTAASFPLRFNHADAYIGEGAGARTVLVGDAAHTIHPLAGQGLNLGLGDVESLYHCIRKTVLNGGDIGSFTALSPYARERYFENHKVMSACDKLHKLYSTTAEPVVWARSVGLEVLNELDSVKAAIMLNAGSRSSHPRSAQQLGANITADALAGLARGVHGVRTLGEAAGSMAGQAVARLARSLR